MNFDHANQRWRIGIDKRIDGRRVRLSRLLPRGTSEAEARAIEDKMVHDLTIKPHLVQKTNGWTEYVEAMAIERNSWMDKALSKCRSRSGARGHAATITKEHLIQVMHLSQGRCAITGLAFSDLKLPGHAIRPYYHSIDRIDCSLGYTPGNIRLVCAGVNVAMMHWGEAVFSDFAVGYVLNKFSATANAINNIGGQKDPQFRFAMVA